MNTYNHYDVNDDVVNCYIIRCGETIDRGLKEDMTSAQ